ncbi:MAG: tyrosine-type recombinase/integrase [Calditrichia bacterium]
MWHYQETEEKTKYLTQEQVRRLFAQITSPRDRVMFDMMYKYGLRASEVGLLRLKDLKWERNRIKIWRLKHGKSREYMLFSDTSYLLGYYLRDIESDLNIPLFLSRNKNPISRKTIDWHIKRYAPIAGIPKELHHAHVLRHSIAVHMGDAGFSQKDVQFHLGHKRLESTSRYMAISGRRQHRIFEKMQGADEIVSYRKDLELV